ncbi:MAG TPA: GNAT family N-acetyltransferase [Oculatellaceae cyanobacterium]
MQTSKTQIVIDSFQPTDFEVIRGFVESLQEYERAQVPELKTGAEIGANYTKSLIEKIADRDGIILIAKIDSNAVGFVCAWIDEDDDPLLRDEARRHAYVSDIFVDDACRRRGVARLLLQSVETEMRQRGCERIRICTKATNLSAWKCYEANGYQPYEVILSKPLIG